MIQSSSIVLGVIAMSLICLVACDGDRTARIKPKYCPPAAEPDTPFSRWTAKNKANPTPEPVVAQSPELAQANALLGQNDVQGAYDVYSRIIEREPSSSAYVGRVMCALLLKKIDTVWPDLDRAVELAPDDPSSAMLYYFRGQVLWESSKSLVGSRGARALIHTRVLADMNKAIALDAATTGPLAYYIAGLAEARLGHEESAARLLATGAKLAPGDKKYAVSARALPTICYWSRLMDTIGEGVERVKNATDLETRCTIIRSTADAIALMPCEGVDEDAVRAGLAAKAALRNAADTVQYVNDPTRLLESFIRGANGDPFGAAVEMGQAEQKATRQMNAAGTILEDARSLLSSRYGEGF